MIPRRRSSSRLGPRIGCLAPRLVSAARLAPALPGSSLSIGWAGAFSRALWRGLRALQRHWIGDLIGAASLFALLWAALLIGHGLGVSP